MPAPPWPSSATTIRSVPSIVGDGDRRLVRLGVADDVGERLGDHEVRGDLDPRIKALLDRVDPDDQRQPAGQARDGGRQPARRQDRRRDAVDDLTQRRDRLLGLDARVADQLARLGVGTVDLGGRQLDRQQHPDQPLLGAIVQVTADPPALLVGGGDDPRAGIVDLRGPGALGGLTQRRLLGLDPLGRVAEDDDRTPFAGDRQRRRGVGDAELRAVTAPEAVVVDAHGLPGHARTQHRALLLRERGPVPVVMVDRRMADPAQQRGLLVPQELQRRRIGERHAALVIDDVDGIGNAREQRLEHVTRGEPERADPFDRAGDHRRLAVSGHCVSRRSARSCRRRGRSRSADAPRRSPTAAARALPEA